MTLIIKIRDFPGIGGEELGRLAKDRFAGLIHYCRLALLNSSIAVEEVRLNVSV